MDGNASQERHTPTIGQKRVRYDFNPSHNAEVADIKINTADLIDLCEAYKQESEDGETKRLWALAQTAYEEASMWAVKAVTSGNEGS
jgi:hypothetical protein